jgi:hypothetical protein
MILVADMAFPTSPEIQDELLLFLLDQGRAISCKDVYAPVARALNMSEDDLRLKVSDGKRSKWEISCQGARDRLVKLGLMNKGPLRVWSLTIEGEKRAVKIRNAPNRLKSFL